MFFLYLQPHYLQIKSVLGQKMTHYILEKKRFKTGQSEPIGWTVHLLSNRIIKSIGFRKEAEKWQDKS